MLRLILLIAPAIVIMAGFAAPFVIHGAEGFLLAVLLILIGSVALWFIENKTVRHLDKGGFLNKILNTKDGSD